MGLRGLRKETIMKKLVYVLLTFVLVMGLAACGGSQGGGSGDSDFTWTREGTFQDENKNVLIITKPTGDEEHEDQWAVSVILGEEVHGWFLDQKGETLAGNLNSEVDDTDTDYVVTISEEGEDGLMMEVEGGDTYHFTKVETPDPIGVLKVNTEGLGTIAVGPEGETVEFEEDFPNQSTVINVTEPTKYILRAKADEGYKFVKWTKDGEDFSEEADITVDVDSDVEYIAVFEPAE